jgi:hypothetical protein
MNGQTTSNALGTLSTKMAQFDSGRQAATKALLFLAAFAIYLLRLSPALDEIDPVQFAMGVR